MAQSSGRLWRLLPPGLGAVRELLLELLLRPGVPAGWQIGGHACGKPDRHAHSAHRHAATYTASNRYDHAIRYGHDYPWAARAGSHRVRTHTYSCLWAGVALDTGGSRRLELLQ